MVVCPIYQLPARASQIYMQAISRSVCIFTYSHLAVLLAFAEIQGALKAQELLHELFKSTITLHPSKESKNYWSAINTTMLSFSENIVALWQHEKKIVLETIALARTESLTHLAKEREKIMRMNHDEALAELIKINKIQKKIETIQSISNNHILEIG